MYSTLYTSNIYIYTHTCGCADLVCKESISVSPAFDRVGSGHFLFEKSIASSGFMSVCIRSFVDSLIPSSNLENRFTWFWFFIYARIIFIYADFRVSMSWSIPCFWGVMFFEDILILTYYEKLFRVWWLGRCCFLKWFDQMFYESFSL